MAGRRKEGMSGGLIRDERLGTPMEQARNKILRRFKNLLKPGATELDILGIKGIGGKDSYLKCLYVFKKKPPTIHGQLSPQARLEFNAELDAMLQAEIEKYEAILGELEKSRVALKAYVLEVEIQMNGLRKSMFRTSETQDAEVLREHKKLSNAIARGFIRLARRDLRRCYGLLAAMK